MTDQTITDAELDEWERIEKAATPGPWVVGYGQPTVGQNDDGTLKHSLLWSWRPESPHLQRVEDASAAVTARNAFPRLIAEHRKLRAHIIDTVGEEGLAELLSQD